MRRLLYAIAFAVAVCPSAFAHFAATAVAPPGPGYRMMERDVRTQSQTYCLTLAIYFEGGSTDEPEVGQRHIARVIHERARAKRGKWGGSDICDVVFYMRKGVCQFSFSCLPIARRTPTFGVAWRQAHAIAEEELRGTNDVEERSIRYYMNAALTPLRNACRFRKEFVKVTNAGRHEFFREPTADERTELANGRFEECERYAQQLREQEARRKRLAALKKKKKHKHQRLAAR